MTLKKMVFCLAAGMVFVGFPLQSVTFGQLGKRLSKKSDCATGSVASGEAGCCSAEGGGCCASEGGGCMGCGSVFEMGDGSSGAFPFTVLEPNAIYITVNLPEKSLDRPEEAVLTVNGDPTKSEGASRRFIVRDLEYGKEYEFKVAAVMKNRAGVELMQVETAKLRVGDMHAMTFKPVRRKADIEREEAEKAASGSEEDAEDEDSEEDAEEGSDDPGAEAEEVDASEPVAMAFPFSLD